MNKEENKEFILKSESLVKPLDVTTISFLGDFNKFLPKKTQHEIMLKGSIKVPYMGFIVDPYCFFLSYKIKNTEAVKAMLSEDYELVETSIFKGEEKCPLIIISSFTVRTSAFIGTRLEFYVIARNKKTGLMSWLIIDYETNTNSYDPKNGFCGYTSDPSVCTTSPYGELIVDFKGVRTDRRYTVSVDLKKGSVKELEEALWIEGNLSVDYGGELRSELTEPFSLIFDPYLMKEALEIPLEHITIHENSYMDSLIDSNSPVCAAVFPYSQHFIIKQDLKRNEITNETGLYAQIKTFLNIKNFKTMSGDDIKKPLFAGILLSSIINFCIIVFLLILLFL